MWAARQWSPLTQFTTINPAAMCLLVAVPVRFTAANHLSTGVPRKFQVYSQLDLGYAAAEKKQQIRKKSAEEQVEEEKEGNSKEKLSGSDVLEALQKATAQKMKKKRNGRDSRKVIGHGRKGTPEDEAMADYGNNKIVRPLNIKEDWGTRLDELEKRLEQLNMHNS